ELSNLLAGNIQILLKVTGSSRTFKGEETAGLACVEDAWRRIGAGQAEIALVGGALNAEREDLLLGYELGCNLWSHPHASVWERAEAGGG
ncbi:beta-ketoacyl synthase N-terminal-like domain-containing protein, partial [Escherichia coli]|uniref:beta-ketoacyl synthase N-terminal-like domain-containing protein n=1 Tax=Escherichia coli TaxID=562 RepID=UPI0027380814